MLAFRTALAASLAVLLTVSVASAAAPHPKPKPDAKPEPGTTAVDEHAVFVAMVLLPKPLEPSSDDVLAAYQRVAPKGPELAVAPSPDANGPAMYALGRATVTVELVPAPVADDKADAAAAASLHGFLKDWRPETHRAHLVVSLAPDPKRPRRMAYIDFLHATAAVASAAHAGGVYLVGGGLTNPSGFFIDAVSQDPPLVVGYTGIQRVYERDPAADPKTPPTRFGLLSRGMTELGLPDLYFTAPLEKASDGLEYFLDLLSYMVSLGKAPPDGDTVGRSDDEKLPVRYEASPADTSVKVWRVDLP
ncbi:MAG: DUF4261 domain-containing protein [Myxococcota bacterium]